MNQRYAPKSISFLLVLILASSALADVAPDAGFTNVPADLVLETTADLSGYRFFLESPMGVEEVELKASTTVIAATGRGGAARYVKLIAVPLSDMMTISGDLSGALLDSFIREKRFPNARELLSHHFQATITIVEKPVWKPPIYRLAIENGIVTAAKLEVVPLIGGSSDRSLMIYAIPVVAAGVLLTIALAIVGIWLFRRSRKKV